MFERKKEICKWLNKSDYALDAGYSEIDSSFIDRDSYRTILKKVIAHRKEILALPDEEPPAPDAPFEREANNLEFDDFIISPIHNGRSKKRQLYDSYCAIYRLTAIIDYYDSILLQNTKINEYKSKYENDIEAILCKKIVSKQRTVSCI